MPSNNLCSLVQWGFLIFILNVVILARTKCPGVYLTVTPVIQLYFLLQDMQEHSRGTGAK